MGCAATDNWPGGIPCWHSNFSRYILWAHWDTKGCRQLLNCTAVVYSCCYNLQRPQQGGCWQLNYTAGMYVYVIGSCMSEPWPVKGDHSRLWFQGVCNAAWKCFPVEKVDWRWQWSHADWSRVISQEWVLIDVKVFCWCWSEWWLA